MTTLHSPLTQARKRSRDFTILDVNTMSTVVSTNKPTYSETTASRIRRPKREEIWITLFGELIMGCKGTMRILCQLHQMHLTQALKPVWRNILEILQLMSQVIAARFSTFTKICWMLEKSNTIIGIEHANSLTSKIHSCNLMRWHFR